MMVHNTSTPNCDTTIYSMAEFRYEEFDDQLVISLYGKSPLTFLGQADNIVWRQYKGVTKMVQKLMDADGIDHHFTVRISSHWRHYRLDARRLFIAYQKRSNGENLYAS